ncbi:MAG: helix-turn-helix domain-containing protein, partial [Pseudomonadota bacterium]|nr:helix-turn-helix domain-containing protein [Pseudomonadota bacterium]
SSKAWLVRDGHGGRASAPRLHAFTPLALKTTAAQWLLYFTEHSITDIGERCGFADTAHFSRHFRAAYGQSPSQLRRDPKGREEAGVDPFFLHIGTRLGQG